MLLALPQFALQAPSLQPEIGGNRRKTVVPVIGPGDPLRFMHRLTSANPEWEVQKQIY